MNTEPITLVKDGELSVNLIKWLKVPDGWYGYTAIAKLSASFYSSKEWKRA